MNVVFLITALDYSGGPKMMAWVANQFAKNGHKVTFVSVYSEMIGQPLDKSIDFIPLNFNKSSSRLIRNTIEMYKIQKRVKQCIDDLHAELVVGFLYSVDYFFTLFNRNKEIKILLSQRLDPYTEKGISKILKNKIIKKADGIVFQSFGARDYYNNIVVEKSRVIPNPVTDKTLSYCKNVKKFEEREDVVVLPARLNIMQKRQDIMINAFELVLDEFPNMKLVLLGDGPDKQKLYEMINEKKLENNIKIVSAVPSAEDFTQNCKIVCLTSDFEGLPNSIIEALAMGLNVVATDCSPGGARMLIKDGVNGYIVNRGDYHALASRIIDYLNDIKKANLMGNEAKKIAYQYSEQKISSQWIEFAENLVKQNC